MADDEVRLLAEAKKLPMVDRVAHANWKARNAAYEDIKLACQRVYEDSDPCLAEYGSLFGKAVGDSNAAAQDKALDALVAYLSKASEQHASKMSDRTCSAIVNKALTGKTSAVMKATEALLQFVELQQGDKVMEALLTSGLTHKVPKVVITVLDILIQIFAAFGTKTVPPQPLFKALPALFESKDGKAREKVKDLVVELSRWVGAEALRASLFPKMRDAMKDDIEKAIAALQQLGIPKPKPERITRREQAALAAAAASGAAQPMEVDEGTGGAAPAAVVEDDTPSEMDPFDITEPKDILPSLKKEFWEGLESKKWSDRKAQLTVLKDLASYPHLASGRDYDYGDVNRELRKVITKDANIQCVAEAILCCGAMAKSIRSGYSATAKNLAEVLLEKYKEKNSAVGKAVSEALSLMHKYCWGLLDVSDSLAAALVHANPKVKEDTLAWLAGEVSAEAKPVLSKLAPILLPPAAKCAEEAAPALREAAVGFMVAFAHKFGNPAVLDKFTAKLDDARKKAIEKGLAEAAGGAGAGAAAGGAAPGGTGPGSTMGRPGAGAGAAPSPMRASTTRMSTASLLAQAGKASRPGTSTGARVASTSGTNTGSGGAKKGTAGKDVDADDEASLSAGTLTKDAIVARFTDMFGEVGVTQLGSDDWKVRLAAMEHIAAFAVNPTSAQQHCAVLAQGMGALPGWSEKNFQVMAKQFEVVRTVATLCPGFSKHDAFVGISGAIDKLADLKLKGPAVELLLALCEAVGPQFVAVQLHKKAAAHKNPKVLSEALAFLALVVEEFGLASLPVKNLLEWAKEDLQSANAAVRNAVVQLLGVMHRFLGPPLGDMIRSDVKPALMAAIDAEFQKNPKRDAGAYAPARTSRVEAKAAAKAGGKSSGGGSAAVSSSGAGAGPKGGYDTDDLLPRQDISGSITSSLLERMGGANWKDRKAAMDEVEQLLVSAGNRIQPQVGDLLGSLKQRMSDSNKNLVCQALQLAAKLARAMGRPIERMARPLLAPALRNISDQKSQVRGAVVELLDAWAAAAGIEALLPELAEALTGGKTTADGRADGVAWLATGVVEPGRASAEQLPEVIKALALGSGDKAAEVRASAARLAEALTQRFSAPELSSALGYVSDQAQRRTASEALGKALGTGPLAAGGGGGLGSGPSSGPSSAASSRPTSAVRTSTNSALRASTTGRPGSASGAGGLRSSAVGLRSSSAASSRADLLSQQAQQDEGPALLLDRKKDERARKGKFRPTKFEVRPDEASTLEAELSPLVSAPLRAALFAKDFRKHCEAAAALVDACGTLTEEVLGILDLLLRWCVLRIVESNTQSLVKVLELLKAMMDAVAASGARLSEYEAKLMLPAVVDKAGHNQDKIRQEHRELLRKACVVYPASKVVLFIRDGLDSKNNKTRVVCAEEIGSIIDQDGPSVYRVNRQVDILGSVAKLVTERDNTLRQAVLGTMEAVYCCEGDGIWKWLGRLSEQQRSLIEERLKYTDRELAKQGLKPGFRSDAGADAANGDGMEWEPGSAVKPSTPGGGGRIGGGAGATPGSAGGRGSPMRRSIPVAPSAAGANGGGYGSGSSGGGAASVMDNVRASMPAGLGAAAGAGGYDAGAGAGGMSAGHPLSALVGPNPMGFNPALAMSSNHLPAAAAAAAAAAVAPSPIQQLRRDSDASMREDFEGCMRELQRSGLEEGTIQVMKLLCYEFQDLDARVFKLFRDSVDSLVELLCARMDEIFAHAGDSVAAGVAHNNRACKYVLNVMANVFNLVPLAATVGEAALRRTISTVLCCLVDDRIQPAPEGVPLLRALNLLMMKALENSNRTYVFSALIPLLLRPHERLQRLNPASKYESMWYELVVKCTIKVTKALQQDISSVDLAALLLAIHEFFATLGPEELRKRGAREDKPVRMVKTILHEVCKAKGRDVYQYTTHIPGAHLDPAHRPHIFPYIDLNLSTMGVAPPPPGLPPVAPAAPAGALAPGAGAGPAPERPASSVAAGPAMAISRATGVAGVAATAGPVAATSSATAAPAAYSESVAASRATAPVPTTTSAAPVSGAAATPATAVTSGATAGVPPALAPAATAPPHMALRPSSPMFASPAADDASARNTLATIFKRIAEKDTQALIDLYFFKEANPGVDIDTMLSSASTTFKNFIMRGLYKVKNQAQQHRVTGEHTVSVASSLQLPPGSLSGAAAAGGPADGEALVSTTASLMHGNKLGISNENPLSPASPAKSSRVGGENIAALRERMSNIQMALQQTRWAGGAAAPAAPVAAPVPAPAVVGFSPPSADATAPGGLEAIQKRIRDLSMGGGAV